MDFETLVEEYLKLSPRTLAELLALEEMRKYKNIPTTDPYVFPTWPWPNPYQPCTPTPYEPTQTPWVTYGFDPAQEGGDKTGIFTTSCSNKANNQNIS